MREGWKISNLGDVCDVIGGGTPSKRNTAFYEGNIPWATVRDMRNEVLSKTEFHISQEAVNGSSTKIIPGRNVVIATRVGLGKICLLEKDTAINQDLRGVIPKSSKIDFRFLFRWFQSVANQIEEEGTGATVKGVKLPFIKSLQVPLPPLPEQKRIVAILDEASAGIDKAIANTEKNLANARQLFDSYLNSVFSKKRDEWQELSIEEICHSIIDCINKTAPQINGPTPFKMIRTTNVRNGEINLESVKYVDEEIYNKWTRRQTPRKGDIILTREAPMGEVGILDTDEKVLLGQRLVSYRVNPALLDNHFMLYAFQSNYMQSQIHARASGSTVQHMRVPDSKKLKVLLPALHSQEEIVERLASLLVETKRIKAIYQRKLTALAELRQSLLQKAFSGELTADQSVSSNSLKDEAVA